MPTLAEIMAAKAAAAVPPSSGVVIRASDEKAKMAASIKYTLDELAPKVLPPAPRELGNTQLGETFPMDYPPQGSAEDALQWFRSLHSFDTDLGIVIDPIAAQGWIAVKPQGLPKPILLLKLPLLNCPSPGQPF